MEFATSRWFWASVGMAILPVVAVAKPGTTVRMERGAFLRAPAKSRAQLIRQVENDDIVSARYRKYFGLDTAHVVRYLSTLHTGTLPATRKYDVWHIRENGAIGVKNLRLEKGTRVLYDAKDRPALKESCGNPMAPAQTIRREVLESHPPKPPSETSVIVPPAPEALATTPDVVAPAPPAPIVEPVPAAPLVTLTPEPSAGAPQVLAPIVAGGGGGGLLPFLPIVGVPILGTIIPPHHGRTAPPVPEPGSILVFGTGIAMAMIRRRRKTSL